MRINRTMVALMAIVMTMLCSLSAKAEDVMYTILNSADKTMTFYYGEKDRFLNLESVSVQKDDEADDRSHGQKKPPRRTSRWYGRFQDALLISDQA